MSPLNPMKSRHTATLLTRREMLRISAGGLLAVGTGLGIAIPDVAVASKPTGMTEQDSYTQLLRTWCDGLIAHQVTDIKDPALHGGLLCPACGIMHGRCGDAVYPLLRMAQTTNDEKYLRAALLVNEWTERNLSRSNGSWMNDISLSPWQGITIFHSIAIAEALKHHGNLLAPAMRRKWLDRLAAAARFLDGFVTMRTGNINYPITSSLAFTLCGQLLENSHYLERARTMARDSLEYFTPNGLIFGEGHPATAISPKGCRPVDLGYNVEESLPALALYSILNNDEVVLAKTVGAMKTHMEFMMPDGGWDNSWGTRNYKWSYWGSRTSDGCHPAYVLLADHDPAFMEVARRNLGLMSACTHDGLLFGGPDYHVHGDRACIHHTFTHAKAIATVLDRGANFGHSTGGTGLPREKAYGVKSYPEIGTYLAAVGNWRATVTEYDFNYIEDVQTNGSKKGGGHATGGALTTLFYQGIGPVLTASMTDYAMVEISNQQAFTDSPHMPLTARIEYALGKTYTSLSDFTAKLTAETDKSENILFEAHGRMLSSAHEPLAGEGMTYRLSYRFAPSGVEIAAKADSAIGEGLTAPLRFILPVISRSGEVVERLDDRTIRIHKSTGVVEVRTDHQLGFNPIPEERTFNLVPGFECVPLSVSMESGKEIRIRLEVKQPA